MADEKRPPRAGHDAERSPDGESAGQPIYRKPKLQRHDQIEQVRPYGPSEI